MSEPLTEKTPLDFLRRLKEMTDAAGYKVFIKPTRFVEMKSDGIHARIFQPVLFTRGTKSVEQWFVEHPTDAKGLTLS